MKRQPPGSVPTMRPAKVEGANARSPTAMTRLYGVPVPEALYEAIEVERDRLSKAASVLGCLTIAMEYSDDDPGEGPYFPDVARVAADLVRRSINGLDSVALHQRVAADRVKEGGSAPLLPFNVDLRIGAAAVMCVAGTAAPI